MNKIRCNRRKLLLFIAACLFCGALPAQNVSYNFKTQSLKSVLHEIEKQTGLSIFYEIKDINENQKITKSFDNVPVEKVLSSILSPNVEYKIQGKMILISKKQASSTTQQGNVKKLKGKIVDESNSPIIGATVMVKGSTKGTTTNIDGEYELENVPSNATIEISYIGYQTVKLSAKDKSIGNIILKEDNKILSEVVVVGYGIEKKVNVVGSISTVSSDKLQNRSTPSLTNALTGQMPGVTIRQTSGSPGSDAGEIRVRGVGSFGATPSALVLIDGIPGELSSVHSDDVESISVLKDASTAAIYGSRAANGVILVTTKVGKEGRTNVNYNGYVGTSSATSLPNKVDSWEYATLYNKADGSEVYSQEEIQKLKDGSDPDHYANNRYVDQLFKSALQTGHDLSISGGNDNNRYMLSFGYLYQNGIIKKNDYSRYNGRLNLITKLWPKVTLTTRLQGVYGVQNQPNVPYGKDMAAQSINNSNYTGNLNSIIANSIRWPGIVPTVLSNGMFGSGEEGSGTPISWLSTPSFVKNDSHSVSVNERLDYTPIKDLRISLIGAYSYTGANKKNFRSTYTTAVKTSTANYIFEGMTKDIYKTFQATIDYNKTIANHNFGALVGYSWEQDDYRYIAATRNNLPSDDYPEIDTGDADTSSNTAGGYGWALQSLFGRAKYNFKERYLADFTFRYDGSSRFPKDNRYAFFPSAAIGWRLSEENFIKDNFTWINNLKIKASYGKLGNQNIGNYPYQSVYVNGYNYPFGSSLSQGVAMVTAVDPTLHWEETKTTDFGIEGNLWNGLLNFDITYFKRKTTGILFSPSASVSKVFGFSLSQMNMGALENKGFEFSVGHRNNIGEFNYNATANFSIINNKVLTLGLADVVQDNGLVGNGTYFIGYPMNIYYGYKTDGVFLDQADIDSWHNQSAIAGNSKPGDIRYVDVDGDGSVTAKDRVVLGSTIPKYTFGLSLGASYKGFDFSAQLQGVAKVSGYLSGYAGHAFFGYGSIQRWQADGCFDPENPERYPAYPRLELIQNSSNNTLTSDFWVRNASYLRVKNVQIGYALPKSIIKGLGINSLRVYVQCENPYTFNHYPEGWDPEINTDGSYYPILKTYTFGLNLQF